jgi:HlyD family secretion protein
MAGCRRSLLMSRRRIVKLLLVVLVVVIGAMLLWRLTSPSRPAAAELRLSGNIEVTDAEVSFRIAGHVVERPVREGDRVLPGALIARLDSADLEHAVALQQAEVERARAVYAEMAAGFRTEEIARAEATLVQAEAELVRAASEWQRDRELFAQDLIAAREAETSHAAHEVAQGRVGEAGAQLALLRKGFRVEQVEQARAQLQLAEEALAQARTRLGYAHLTAPMAGVVLSENIEPGEYVAAGTPVVTLGRLDPVWLRGYIAETDLGRVKLGQPVRVTTDTYPDRDYRGTVTFIAQDAEFTPKNVQTDKERVKLVYRIKITLPNPDQELKPGMPADAVIDLADQ